MGAGPYPVGSSVQRIFAGGLAGTTESRLAALRRWGGRTSFLRPSDAIAVTGLRELAQLIGVSYAHLSEPATPPARAAVWLQPDFAVRHALPRRRALDRLRQQARLLGADAVVGVAGRWTGREVVLTGTAVAMPGRWTGEPVLTLLSGAELATLLAAGLRPVGSVFGSARVWVTGDPAARRPLSQLGNVELTGLTHGAAAARDVAAAGLAEEASRLSAGGVLGLRFVTEPGLAPHSATGGWPGTVITVHASGTAVRRHGGLALRRVTPVVGTRDPAEPEARAAGETLLLRTLGYHPAEPVVGSSVVDVRAAARLVRVTGEAEPLSEAIAAARARALEQLHRRAHGLGAVAVIRVRCGARPLGSGLTEFTVHGLAVGSDRGGPAGAPVSSTLSATDLWALRRQGEEPLRVVAGTCVTPTRERGVGDPAQWLRSYELAQHTQLLTDMREHALRRLQDAAIAAGAADVVAASLTAHDHGWDGLLVEHLAVGTAIRTSAGPPAEPEDVAWTIDLAGR